MSLLHLVSIIRSNSACIEPVVSHHPAFSKWYLFLGYRAWWQTTFYGDSEIYSKLNADDFIILQLLHYAID